MLAPTFVPEEVQDSVAHFVGKMDAKVVSQHLYIFGEKAEEV